MKKNNSKSKKTNCVGGQKRYRIFEDTKICGLVEILVVVKKSAFIFLLGKWNSFDKDNAIFKLDLECFSHVVSYLYIFR